MTQQHETEGTDSDEVARTVEFSAPDPDLAFRVRGRFENRYGDERVVIETPAPWDTPDGMTDPNEVVKGLEWEDHHYTFEESVYQTGDEDCWVVDYSGVRPLRADAEAAGYEWTDEAADAAGCEPELGELAASLEEAEIDRDNDYELVGGDRVRVVYESKQTGDVYAKEGVVSTAVDNTGDPALTTGFTIRRDDGKTNKVKTDDSGAVGVYSTSQFPFMGEVVRVEVLR